MDRISFNSIKILNFFENLNPQKSGIFFSTIIHLIILLFMVGLPNFFSPKDIYVPNIIPIEILNIDEKNNLKKTDTQNQDNNKETFAKQKKFNSSEQLEVKKKININETKIEEKNNPDQPILETKKIPDVEIKEKKKIIIKEKEPIETNEIVMIAATSSIAFGMLDMVSPSIKLV